jgi:hypothetical protein
MANWISAAGIWSVPFPLIARGFCPNSRERASLTEEHANYQK